MYRGQSPAEADLNLLETARRCELYGIKMHPAKVILFLFIKMHPAKIILFLFDVFIVGYSKTPHDWRPRDQF